MKIKYLISKDLMLILFLILIETIFLKIFMYKLFPSKYFFDSIHILAVMNGSSITDASYSFTANFFNNINVFKLTNIQQWGYFISFLFVPIMLGFIIRGKKYSLSQYIFIISSFTLLDIYVFCLSKDIIQFIYFLIIFIITSNKKLGNWPKIILTCLVLLYEALNFRVYYAIMAMLIVTIYLVYIKFIQNKKISKKQVIKILLLSISLFFLEVFIVQLFSYENYDAILNARYSVNIWRQNGENANTIINEILGKNTNFIIFIGNYLINLFRLMIPLELILKGPKQIIFAIYQIFITFNLIKSISKINNKNCLLIIFTISFMMISIIFEPDFGSFVRHESALVLFLLEIMRISGEREGKSNEEN